MSTGPMTDVIRSISEFLAYTDEMTPHLALMGAVLGIGNFAVATVEGPGSLDTKCLAILKRWLDVTPNPMWKLFCEQLEKTDTFNNLRARIAQDHGVSVPTPRSVQPIVPPLLNPTGSQPDMGNNQPDGAVQLKKQTSTIPGSKPDMADNQPDGAVQLKKPTSTIPGWRLCVLSMDILVCDMPLSSTTLPLSSYNAAL